MRKGMEVGKWDEGESVCLIRTTCDRSFSGLCAERTAFTKSKALSAHGSCLLIDCLALAHVTRARARPVVRSLSVLVFCRASALASGKRTLLYALASTCKGCPFPFRLAATTNFDCSLAIEHTP